MWDIRRRQTLRARVSLRLLRTSRRLAPEILRRRIRSPRLRHNQVVRLLNLRQRRIIQRLHKPPDLSRASRRIFRRRSRSNRNRRDRKLSGLNQNRPNRQRSL
jgi:hypothetical protein